MESKLTNVWNQKLTHGIKTHKHMESKTHTLTKHKQTHDIKNLTHLEETDAHDEITKLKSTDVTDKKKNS